MGILIHFLIPLLLANFCSGSTNIRCSVPSSWLSGNPTIQRSTSSSGHVPYVSGINFYNTYLWTKWPKGKVTYKLDATLTAADIIEVRKAFNEYHTKTCIQFLPWEQGDVDFVNIERNDSVCGVAHVCKIGGYQFAQFGGNCRTMSTMVHELGHSLCLGHEHQREDRDEHLTYSSCHQTPSKDTHNWVTKGIYDYRSIMHYWCDANNACLGGRPTQSNVNNCGGAVTTGLSVMDVDGINSLYNCQGCTRHRWRPAQSLTQADRENLYNFGYYSQNGAPLYPCRAASRGEVSAGTFDDATKSCKISHGQDLVTITDNVEVLTIPGSLNWFCYKYELVSRAAASPRTAIPAGSSNWDKWVGYIAYASKSGTGGVTERSIGKVWTWTHSSFGYSADMPAASGNFFPSEYQVLSCHLDSQCMSMFG
ncbi:unnamed protein product [Orchesella dallaii]|uniref:Metalloendopeptidase n=1 Tax=Orchesella dallaii TaxID=48710 RepID=A0ABP1RUL8_9HEXA